MKNESHLMILRQGIKAWNKWRSENHEIIPNFTQAYMPAENLRKANLENADFTKAYLNGADFSEANLCNANFTRAALEQANLSKTNLCKANLTRANLYKANLNKADVNGTNFTRATLNEAEIRAVNLLKANFTRAELNGVDFQSSNLNGAIFREAKLGKANFMGASLVGTDFYEAYLEDADFTSAVVRGANLGASNLLRTKMVGANLVGADLRRARFVFTDLRRADLTGSKVFGVSVWGVNIQKSTTQSDLIITNDGEPAITVDNLEVAQFIYLLLNNRKIRDIIDTVTSKAVLILGRFTPERKVVLNALRDALRNKNYLPIIFDFEKPSSRNLTETVSTLAHMAGFIIADITDARSILQELQAIVPHNASVPVQPLILSSRSKSGMFKDIEVFPWVLSIYKYNSLKELLNSLEEKVIAPLAAKKIEIEEKMRRCLAV